MSDNETGGDTMNNKQQLKGLEILLQDCSKEIVVYDPKSEIQKENEQKSLEDVKKSAISREITDFKD